MPTKDTNHSGKTTSPIRQNTGSTGRLLRTDNDEEQDLHKIFKDVLDFRHTLVLKESRVTARPLISCEKLFGAYGIYRKDEKKILIDPSSDPIRWIAHEGTHFVQDMNGIYAKAESFSKSIAYKAHRTPSTVKVARNIMRFALIEPEAYLYDILFVNEGRSKSEIDYNILKELRHKINNLLGWYPDDIPSVLSSIHHRVRSNNIGSIPDDAFSTCFDSSIEEHGCTGYGVGIMSDFVGIAFAALVFTANRQDVKRTLETVASGPAGIMGAVDRMKPAEVRDLRHFFEEYTYSTM